MFSIKIQICDEPVAEIQIEEASRDKTKRNKRIRRCEKKHTLAGRK